MASESSLGIVLTTDFGCSLATALETNSSGGHWMPTLISLKFSVLFVETVCDEVSCDLRPLQSTPYL